jgi:hypothetical protein
MPSWSWKRGNHSHARSSGQDASLHFACTFSNSLQTLPALYDRSQHSLTKSALVFGSATSRGSFHGQCNGGFATAALCTSQQNRRLLCFEISGQHHEWVGSASFALDMYAACDIGHHLLQNQYSPFTSNIVVSCSNNSLKVILTLHKQFS